MNKLIVITGPDGSGKSSVCKGVSELLNTRLKTAVTASIWDSLISSGAFEKSAVEKYLVSLSGNARTLFLMHSVLNSLSIAQKKNADFIVMDSYFYKYAATELAYDVSSKTVKGACEAFIKPDLTFYLQVSAESAWLRKQGQASAYEKGAKATATTDHEQFISLQQKAQSHFAALESAYGPWIHLDENSSVSDRVSAVMEKLS